MILTRLMHSILIRFIHILLVIFSFFSRLSLPAHFIVPLEVLTRSTLSVFFYLAGITEEASFVAFTNRETIFIYVRGHRFRDLHDPRAGFYTYVLCQKFAQDTRLTAIFKFYTQYTDVA